MRTEVTHDIIANNLSSDKFDAVNYGIKQDNQAHILSILRDQLYSNKILAVVREYTTNAIDAHIEAGKPDIPIQITTPNSFDPVLKIRDFGPSLTQEQVWQVFAWYGASTKRETNTQTGFLGIGSKSAFAYTDSFQIVSYLNNKKTTYLSFIDESQCGKITKISEVDSDEEQGLEIIIPVQVNDHLKVTSTVKDLGMFFTVPPIVNGNQIDSYVNVTESAYSDDNGIMLSKFSSEINVGSYDNNVIALMGNIPYYLDLKQLNFKDISTVSIDIYSEKHNINLLRIFNRYSIILKCNIGDFQVSASRESVQYKEKSIKYFQEKLVNFITSSVRAHLESVQNSPSYFTALTEHSRDRFGLFAISADYTKSNKIKWNSHELWLRHRLPLGLISLKFFVTDSNLRTIKCSNAQDSISFDPEMFIVINDCIELGELTGRKIISRMRTVFKRLTDSYDGTPNWDFFKNKQVIYLTIAPDRFPKRGNADYRERYFSCYNTMSSVVEELGLQDFPKDRFLFLSELEETSASSVSPQIKSTTSSDSRVYQLMDYPGTKYWKRSYFEQLDNLSTNKKYAYCILSHQDIFFPIVNPDGSRGITTMSSHILSDLRYPSISKLFFKSGLSLQDIIGHELIGIRSHMLPKVKKMNNLVPLEKVLSDLVLSATEDTIKKSVDILTSGSSRYSNLISLLCKGMTSVYNSFDLLEIEDYHDVINNVYKNLKKKTPLAVLEAKKLINSSEKNCLSPNMSFLLFFSVFLQNSYCDIKTLKYVNKDAVQRVREIIVELINARFAEINNTIRKLDSNLHKFKPLLSQLDGSTFIEIWTLLSDTYHWDKHLNDYNQPSLFDNTTKAHNMEILNAGCLNNNPRIEEENQEDYLAEYEFGCVDE